MKMIKCKRYIKIDWISELISVLVGLLLLLSIDWTVAPSADSGNINPPRLSLRAGLSTELDALDGEIRGEGVFFIKTLGGEKCSGLSYTVEIEDELSVTTLPIEEK